MKSLVKHLDATCLKTVMANSIVYFAIWHRLCCTFCIPFSLSFCLIIKRKQPTDLMEICLNLTVRKYINFLRNIFKSKNYCTKKTPRRCFKRFALDRTGCFMNQCHLLREIFFWFNSNWLESTPFYSFCTFLQ
jgi:hypothetical protein